MGTAVTESNTQDIMAKAVAEWGVYPTMITPFTAEGDIDWQAVDGLVEWYIESGVTGIFAACQSSEMYHLTDEERIQLATRVVNKVAGRVKVVASGSFGGDIKSQAAFVNRMAPLVDGVVVLTCQMASEQETDEVWLER